MKNKFYWAILSKPLSFPMDATIFEIQSIKNGILEKNLRRLTINHKYRILRKVYYREVIEANYYHKKQWIKRLRNDTTTVKKWLKDKKGLIRKCGCLK